MSMTAREAMQIAWTKNPAIEHAAATYDLAQAVLSDAAKKNGNGDYATIQLCAARLCAAHAIIARAFAGIRHEDIFSARAALETAID